MLPVQVLVRREAQLPFPSLSLYSQQTGAVLCLLLTGSVALAQDGLGEWGDRPGAAVWGRTHPSPLWEQSRGVTCLQHPTPFLREAGGVGGEKSLAGESVG